MLRVNLLLSGHQSWTSQFWYSLVNGNQAGQWLQGPQKDIRPNIFLNVWSEVSKLVAWRRSFCGALVVLILWQPDTIDRQWNLVSSFDDKWKPSLTNWCATSKCVAAPLKNYKIPNHLQSEMYLLAWGWRFSPDWRQQHNQGCKSPGSLRNSHKK